MRKGMLLVPALAVGAALLFTPAASASERLLTLHSPQIATQPYVHDTHTVILRPDGRHAPAAGGYITSIEEMSLVDSTNPSAKPLPVNKMMVHHLLYFAPGRVDQGSGSCWPGAGFITGRGEEHPSGVMRTRTPRIYRDIYGINNRLPNGQAPTWYLTAMVMNHYRAPKSFYIRLRVRYTTDGQRRSVMPIVVGNCSTLVNGMAYDVPGGGQPGSNFIERTRWTVPPGMSGRIIGAASHQHGGAKYHTLESLTCKRRIFKAPAYYGTPDHIYNTIRPILHEPGPIGNGAYGSLTGIPIRAGEVLQRTAVHDAANLHVAAMGFWVLQVVHDSSVGPCAPMPRDIVEINRPPRFASHPNFGLVVPQLARTGGPLVPYNGQALSIGDQFFAPQRIVARRGQRITWRFGGSQPHSVTVANGPRGFSSLYTGNRFGTYTFTAKVAGTYRLTCLVHPTTMAQTVVVRR